MQSVYDDNLLKQGILNAKTGDLQLARRYLEMALYLADDRDTRTEASYWMSRVCSDRVEQRKYLEDALANDPGHPEARIALAILDGKIDPGELVNPDALPLQKRGLLQADASRFMCPKCGARMVFDGDGRTLVCEHCSRNQTLNNSAPQFEQDFISTMATGRGHRTPVRMKAFTCQGCGAQFIFSAQQISGVCAYCGSPHVTLADRDWVEPDSIVPMAFNQQQANQLLLAWFQKHDLKPDEKVMKPKGSYLTAWTFDLMGVIPWNGTVYRNKKVVPVSGEENVSFNDIIISASFRLPASLTVSDFSKEFLAGYETSNAPAYDPRFLSGWPAEVYEIAMSDASLEARKQAIERIRDRLTSEKGHINDLNYSTANVSILSFKLVLIPIWQTHYSIQDQAYQVLMNGQTGKVSGEMPRQGLMGWIEKVLGE